MTNQKNQADILGVTQSLYVGRPNLGDRAGFMLRVEDILDRRWLSNAGKYVKEFETRVAELLGVKHCVAMCNATVALEIATRALGLKGEVIVPSFTFIATAHCLQWQEITPVFCDIDPVTHNLDPAKVESMITPRTTGILAVHLWGRACNVAALEEIANRRGLQLIFDASHAFGCSHQGRMIGGFGRAEVFSFHATKFINTLEGGIVATNDDDLAHRMRVMKNFGFTDYDQVDYLGVNGKMNEISAAMGLTNLESMDSFIAINRRNYELYRDGLSGLEGLSLIVYPTVERCNYQYVVVEVDETKLGITRDELVNLLHGQGIIARRYFYPGCHRMEPYHSHQPNSHLMLSQTERIAAMVMVLPTGQSVNPADVAKICGTIRMAAQETFHSLTSKAPVSLV
jgi:dTDP-4-amino-4,6-dideoxygalactose transaminase